jgi:DNA gyrase/topoisomerase IV subunit A
MCYTEDMKLEEALKEIKRLEKLHQDLSKEHEITLRLLFEANEKLNMILKEIENVVEKYTIERIKKFIPQTEVMKPVVINEVETLVKEKRV